MVHPDVPPDAGPRLALCAAGGDHPGALPPNPQRCTTESAPEELHQSCFTKGCTNWHYGQAMLFMHPVMGATRSAVISTAQHQAGVCPTPGVHGAVR